MDEEDFVTEERVLIPITQRGYIKRMPTKVYKAQGRGGRGVIGMTTRDEDAIVYLLAANTLDTLLFFTDHGKVYQERVYRRFPGRSHRQGIAHRRDPGAQSLRAGDRRRGGADPGRAPFSDDGHAPGLDQAHGVERVRHGAPQRLDCHHPEDNDVLGWARLTQGHDDVILVTEQGQGIRFNEQESARWDAMPAASPA